MPNYNSKISLGTATLNPAVFQGAVFTPAQENMSLLQHSIDKLDERKERTDQQTAAIMSAINKVNLDSTENNWKRDYVQRVKQKINSAAQFGDYSSALETATRLAGEAIDSPEIRGRERYYTDRTKWLEELKQRNARGEINSDTYDRAVALNKYNYSDTYDSEGNITGGISWTPEFTPVKDLDLSQVYKEIKAFITPSSTSSSRTGGTSQVYIDANGNRTTNINEARMTFSTIKGGGSGVSNEGITAKQWMNAYDAWRKSHPESAAQFEQHRQNTIWKYNQAISKANNLNISEEERNSAIEIAKSLYNTLVDDQGGKLTPENYAKSIANPMLKAMAFNRRATTSKGADTLFNEQYGANLTAASAFGVPFEAANVYGLGSPQDQVRWQKQHADEITALENEGKSMSSSLANSYSGNYGASWKK